MKLKKKISGWRRQGVLVPGQCAQRHGGDGIGLSLCFKVIFEIGRIFFYKTHVIFDLLDILTLQERLEIGWGKPLLRSSVNTLKCRHATSPKKSFLCIWSSSIGRLFLNKNDVRSIWANSRKLLDMLKVLSHLERYDCFKHSCYIFVDLLVWCWFWRLFQKGCRESWEQGNEANVNGEYAGYFTSTQWEVFFMT